MAISWKSLSARDQLVFLLLGAFVLIVTIDGTSSILSDYHFESLSAGEHLIRAKENCGQGNECLNINEALRHLMAIPTSAQEYKEAVDMMSGIGRQVGRQKEEAKNKLDKERQESWARAWRNFQGSAHDDFQCAISTDRTPIVSFDVKGWWWKDDGRCAEREQKRRDTNARIFSYWSTTVRVDTDMDSFWLADEERNCRTLPDDKGRVATVTCDATVHTTHNIPVVFWGGVDRNTVSDWKCRRESETFACRAID